MKTNSRISRLWILPAALLLFTGTAIAGQDVFTLDFDPTLELAQLGLDTSPTSLEALATGPDIDSQVRYLALVAIGRSEYAGALETLTAFCTDDVDPDLQLGAIQGLAELGDPSAVPLFQSIARSSTREASVQSALLGLARRDSPDSRRAMIALARSGEMGRGAMISIIHLFRRSPGDDSDELLRELQGHSELPVRASATIGLSERFGREFDGALVAIAAESVDDLEVWPDIVRRIEHRSGLAFESADELRSPNIDREARLRASQRMADWYESLSQRSGIK